MFAIKQPLSVNCLNYWIDPFGVIAIVAITIRDFPSYWRKAFIIIDFIGARGVVIQGD